VQRPWQGGAGGLSWWDLEAFRQLDGEDEGAVVLARHVPRQRAGDAVAQVVDVHHQATHFDEDRDRHAGGDRPRLVKKESTPMTTSPTTPQRRGRCSSAGLKWLSAQIKRGMTAGATLLT
jgi:hypothetical protein